LAKCPADTILNTAKKKETQANPSQGGSFS